jgi:hypothetical protein
MNTPPSATPPSRFPTLTRCFGRLFNRRTLGRLLAGLAVLATVIALGLAEEHWRGKLSWQHYRHQLEAQGEKFDWKDFIPPRVPDDQNFAMTPFLAPLLDFNPYPLQEGQSQWRDTNGFHRAESFGAKIGNLNNQLAKGAATTVQRMTDLPAWALELTGHTNLPPTAAEASPGAALSQAATAPDHAPPPTLTRTQAAAEVLHALQQYDPVLEELRAASRRPYARFNIRYEGEFCPAILLPHLAVVKRCSLMFQLRASAELALGQTDKAFADTLMALYLADTIKDEPFLISKLVQLAIIHISLRPIWEGLAEPRWSDAQLAEIQQRLGKIDLLADAALRGERAFNLLTIEQLRQTRSINAVDPRGGVRWAVFPLGGFFYQNELFIARMYEQYFVPVADAASQRVYPSRAVANEGALSNAMTGGFPPYRFLAKMLLPALATAPTKLGFGQTRVDEAILACALERYRLENSQVPDSLEQLSPGFLEKMPHDIITGAPFKYRRTANGQFILYSVGWNEKDDGGLVVQPPDKGSGAERRSGSELNEGDWVWQYPAPTEKADNSSAPDNPSAPQPPPK